MRFYALAFLFLLLGLVAVNADYIISPYAIQYDTGIGTHTVSVLSAPFYAVNSTNQWTAYTNTVKTSYVGTTLWLNWSYLNSTGQYQNLSVSFLKFCAACSPYSIENDGGYFHLNFNVTVPFGSGSVQQFFPSGYQNYYTGGTCFGGYGIEFCYPNWDKNETNFTSAFTIFPSTGGQLALQINYTCTNPAGCFENFDPTVSEGTPNAVYLQASGIQKDSYTYLKFPTAGLTNIGDAELYLHFVQNQCYSNVTVRNGTADWNATDSVAKIAGILTQETGNYSNTTQVYNWQQWNVTAAVQYAASIGANVTFELNLTHSNAPATLNNNTLLNVGQAGTSCASAGGGFTGSQTYNSSYAVGGYYPQLNVSFTDTAPPQWFTNKTETKNYTFNSTGLIGWWDLGDTGNNETNLNYSIDLSGQGNAMSVFGGSPQDISGACVVGTCMNFSGLNKDIMRASGLTVPFGWYNTSGVSVGIWLRSYSVCQSSAAHCGIFGQGDDGFNYFSQFGISIDGSGHLEASLYNNTNYYFADSTSTYADTNWHYAVATYAVNPINQLPFGYLNMTIYVDGKNVGQFNYTTFAFDAGQSPVTLGGQGKDGVNPTSGNHHFNGTLDDAMIFNRTLSGAEIAALYDNGCPSCKNGQETNWTAVNNNQGWNGNLTQFIVNWTDNLQLGSFIYGFDNGETQACKAENPYSELKDIPYLRCTCRQFIRSWPELEPEANPYIAQIQIWQRWAFKYRNNLFAFGQVMLFIAVIGFSYIIFQLAVQECHSLAYLQYGKENILSIAFNPIQGCVVTHTAPNGAQLGLNYSSGVPKT